MYLSSEGSFGLRRSCTEVRRPTFWWFCAKNPGIPPQMHRKGDYTHLVNFLRLLVACRRLSSSEGAPAGFWEVFCAKLRPRGRCQAQEQRTPTAVPTAVGVQKTETWLGLPKHNYYRKYIATREIPTCRRAGSALLTMCYANSHAAIMDSTCTELPRGPWGTGGV